MNAADGFYDLVRQIGVVRREDQRSTRRRSAWEESGAATTSARFPARREAKVDPVAAYFDLVARERVG